MRVAWKAADIPVSHAIPVGLSAFCEGIKICSAGSSGASGREEASEAALRSGPSKARSITRSPVIMRETTNVSQAITPGYRAIVLMHSMVPTIGSELRPVN